MKTLIKIAKSYKNTDLPPIQKRIVENIDNTIESIIFSEKLNIALNVCFSYHYFYISGDSDVNTVTTKHTDGSCAAQGSQSKEAENNAYELSHILKAIIKKVATNASGQQFNGGANEKAYYNGRRIFGATFKNLAK